MVARKSTGVSSSASTRFLADATPPVGSASGVRVVSTQSSPVPSSRWRSQPDFDVPLVCTSNDGVTVSWPAFADPESHVARYEVALSHAGNEDTWTTVPQLSATFEPLLPGQEYRARIRVSPHCSTARTRERSC